jgi:hypothetical protein
VFGINLSFLELFIPVAIALGCIIIEITFTPYVLYNFFLMFCRGAYCGKCWKNSRVFSLFLDRGFFSIIFEIL